ncbi:MAG: hypothetical protein M0R17_04315 [Candidatus Omnitrophica bacterium]|jgi:hypothetical protein|nr:hypothetical protein [Candidatus Omnitrophota bacterium]
MKFKKKLLKEEVIKCIRLKDEKNPFIDIEDITSHLFLLNRLPENSSNKIMRKKYRSKKHLSKILINELLKDNKIRINNNELQSYEI